MRVVLDTNVLISALLWKGPPSRILERVRNGGISGFISVPILAEVADVLTRPKFSAHLKRAQVDVHQLIFDLTRLFDLVEPSVIGPVILDDPADDFVISTAVAAQADVIVSGDIHLLQLSAYQKIQIIKPSVLIARFDLPTTN